MSKKNPLTPSGIEQATFRFVAQHLNHCATANVVYNGKTDIRTGFSWGIPKERDQLEVLSVNIILKKSVPLQARGAQRVLRKLRSPRLLDNDPGWW